MVEIMPEQVFVANVSCEYSYNGMLYGYDKSWWEYENRGPEDLPTTTYEELIKQKEEHTEDIVIYQYEGQWYVWPLNFGHFDYYTVEY